jgi:hypothetical protein
MTGNPKKRIASNVIMIDSITKANGIICQLFSYIKAQIVPREKYKKLNNVCDLIQSFKVN